MTAATLTLRNLAQSTPAPRRPVVAAHWVGFLLDGQKPVSPTLAQWQGFPWLETRRDVAAAVDVLTRYYRIFGGEK